MVCGTRCEGRFKGCTAVWSRGATPPALVAPRPSPPRDEEGSSRQSTPPNGAEPVVQSGVPGPVVPQRPPSPRPSDDILRAVVSALETVGAELRAMRAKVDDVGIAPAIASSASHAVEHVAELLDHLPQHVDAAVRTALDAWTAPEPTPGDNGISSVRPTSPDFTP